MSLGTTICPLDCPDACSLEARVEDGRIVALDGSRANPLTDGYICRKVRRLPQALYGEDRVMTPLKRRGDKGKGEFAPVSWDEALESIARGLAEARERFGGESILPLSYGGSNGLLSQDTTDARLFRRLGASRLARTVCSAPSSAAADGLYGKMAGVGYEDYEKASLIVVWGANPHASGVHLVPFLQRARKNGARLVVVDPQRTRLVEHADLHLPVLPGTDLPLALSVVRWLFDNARASLEFLGSHTRGWEELRARAGRWTSEAAASVCGLKAETIEAFARNYADSSPAVIRCGWGLERNRNGGSAVAAVLALPAVAGKFGVCGGGYTLSNSGVWKLVTGAASAAEPVATREINMNRVGIALTATDDPPVKFLFVYNNNPLMTLPNQERVRRGLERDDLTTVVFDSFLTDTARYADIVLPASTFVERREVARGYGAYRMHEGHPVIPGVGESRTNHEVFLDLCRRLGLTQPGDPETEDAVLASLLAAAPDGERLQRELAQNGAVEPRFGRTPVQFVDVFPETPDSKADLFPEALDLEAPHGLYSYQDDPATARHPLTLISPATAKTVSSTLAQLYPDLGGLAVHPDDAAPRNIASGDAVRIFNDYGQVVCRAEVSERIRPGVVLLPKGLWARHTLNGSTSNALSPDTLTDLGAGACFNDARVEIEPGSGLTIQHFRPSRGEM